MHVETVVKLSLKKDIPKIEVTMEPDEESNYTPKEKITYQKIKAYILEKYGFKVSSLYIAQIKDKCGLGKERTGNNLKKMISQRSRSVHLKRKRLLEMYLRTLI